jgi:hypothetical protein
MAQPDTSEIAGVLAELNELAREHKRLSAQNRRAARALRENYERIVERLRALGIDVIA